MARRVAGFSRVLAVARRRRPLGQYLDVAAGAADGLAFYLTPEWSKLADSRVWSVLFGTICVCELEIYADT